jgi:hypothetical protein
MRKLAMVAAVLVLAAAANADTLWGVTNGTGDAGFWSGGEIFTVDTDTGAVDVKATYDTNTMAAFGDIALSPSGDVYVTYAPTLGANFIELAKVNTTTWTFDWTRTLGIQTNSLTFVGNTLYLHAGGGSVDGLYKLDNLTGGPSGGPLNAPTFVGNSGFVGSDGDLFYDRDSGKMYNVFTPGSVGNLAEIDFTNGGATPVGTLNGTAQFGTTDGGFDYGWAGMEFDRSGKLWAGTYWDQNLYSRPDVAAGSNVVKEYDLSASLGGTITGLSIVVPVPPAVALGLVGMAGVGVLRRFRKKTAA